MTTVAVRRNGILCTVSLFSGGRSMAFENSLTRLKAWNSLGDVAKSNNFAVSFQKLADV